MFKVYRNNKNEWVLMGSFVEEQYAVDFARMVSDTIEESNTIKVIDDNDKLVLMIDTPKQNVDSHVPSFLYRWLSW